MEKNCKKVRWLGAVQSVKRKCPRQGSNSPPLEAKTQCFAAALQETYNWISSISLFLYCPQLPHFFAIFLHENEVYALWCKNKKWSVNAGLHDRLISRKLILLHWSFKWKCSENDNFALENAFTILMGPRLLRSIFPGPQYFVPVIFFRSVKICGLVLVGVSGKRTWSPRF